MDWESADTGVIKGNKVYSFLLHSRALTAKRVGTILLLFKRATSDRAHFRIEDTLVRMKGR